MYGIGTVVFTLFTVGAVCQEEMKLISELNRFFNFEHNIFLLDSSEDIHLFIKAGKDLSFTSRTVYVFNNDTNAENNTELQHPTEINSKNSFMIVVPAEMDFDKNLNLLNRMKEIQQLRTDIKIGIFFPHSPAKEMSSLEEFFTWCKKQLIVNIFAATHPHREVSQGPNRAESLLNVFTFDPFGSLGVLNVTGIRTFSGFFRSLDSNFQQYELKFGEPYEVEDELWPTILHHMNASHAIIEHNFTALSEYFENEVHVLPRLRSQFYAKDFLIYTLEFKAMNLLVPASLPYSQFSAYLQNITSNELPGLMLITIAASVMLLSTSRYIKRKRIIFYQSVADVMNLIFNDNSGINYRRLYLVEVFIIVPLTFAGFIIVNLIMSMLLGHLTRPVDQPQINTIEELHRSPFLVLVNTERPKSLAVEVFTKLWNVDLDWNDKVNVTIYSFEKQLERFDTSTSYLVMPAYAEQVLRVQKLLKIKGYHDPRLPMRKVYWSHLINKTFVYFERLNDLIHRIQSAGLYNEWVRRYNAREERHTLKVNLERLRASGTNFENNFEFPTFIIYGWVASAILFGIEIIWKRWKH